MMLDLAEMQFELLPNESSSAGVGFGIGLDVSIDEGGFDPGTAEWVTQDSQNPTRGVTMFGRDILSGPTWAWTMHVNRDRTKTALLSLSELATAWRARDIVDTPGKMAIMRYRIGGRTRRVYGRPRRWAAAPNNQILNGFVPITADFNVVDAYTYDDVMQSVSMSFGTDTKGGFVFPKKFPASTLPSGNRGGLAVVGGDAWTYPVIRVNGPVVNPYVATSLWTANLKLSLASGEYVTIDTRPWKLTVLKNGSTSVSGSLGRRQWLQDMMLKPGQVDFAFGGSASSAGGSATVSWYNANNSL